MEMVGHHDPSADTPVVSGFERRALRFEDGEKGGRDKARDWALEVDGDEGV
jgi:hypothetical protein